MSFLLSYATDGSSWALTATLESQKYLKAYALVDNGADPARYEVGTKSLVFPEEGLAGFWSLEEGAGSTALDSSGNGNTGQWNGSAIGNSGNYYSTSKIGSYAGFFDSFGDYVDMGNPVALQIATSISVVVWERQSAFAAGTRIMSNYAGTNTSTNIGNSGPFVLQAGGSLQNIACNINNATSALSSGGNIVSGVGVWHQVGCVYNGSLITLYVDGAAQGTKAVTGNLSYSNAYPWRIGASGSSTADFAFFGGLDDVRIYNRPLSAGEIQSMYDAGK